MEKDVGAFGDGFQAWPEDIRQRTVPCLIKYKWEHYEEFTSNDVERSYDAEQEALIYRYTTRSGIRMMLVVYSFQTEEYSYTVYEEYELDRSEEIPQSVKFLGTNGRDYFYVVVNGPTEQITKEWISQWGIQA